MSEAYSHLDYDHSHGCQYCGDGPQAEPATPCHPGGRLVEAKIAREMLNALGIVICEVCHRAKTVRMPRNRRFRE